MGTLVDSEQSTQDGYFGLWRLEDLGKAAKDNSDAKGFGNRGDSSLVDAVLRNAKHREINPDRFVQIPTNNQAIQGGCGTVHQMYLQMPSGNGLLVAVKKLKYTHELRKQLAREIRVWIPLGHPNILPFMGYRWSAPDEAWLVSPFCKQGSVCEYILKVKPPMEQRLELLCDTAHGLHYLHAHGVCHGDLKGGNVLVNSQNRAMLCDFGLAKALNGSAAPSGLTSHTQRGTVRYFSPELALEKSGKAKPTKASDVWAWACLGLEILVDTIPFLDELDGAIYIALSQPQTAHPAQLHTFPLLSPDLKYMLRHCWEYQPQGRPWISTIVHLLADLDRTTFKFSENTYKDLTPSEPGVAATQSPFPSTRLRRIVANTKRNLKVSISDESTLLLTIKEASKTTIFSSLNPRRTLPPRQDAEAPTADSASISISTLSAASRFFSLKRRRSAKDSPVSGTPIEGPSRTSSLLSRSHDRKRNKPDNNAEAPPKNSKNGGNKSTQERDKEKLISREPMNSSNLKNHSFIAPNRPVPHYPGTTSTKYDLSPADKLSQPDYRTSDEKHMTRERVVSARSSAIEQSDVMLGHSMSTKSDQNKSQTRIPSATDDTTRESAVGIAL